MIFDANITLLTAGDFTSPQTETDIIPYPFGNFAYDSGVDGRWVCPCIDTAKFYYAIAAFPLLSVAQGNVFTVYVDDVLVTTGFTIHADITLSGNRIAALKFTAAPSGDVTIRCKGRAVNGVVLTNPIDIAQNMLELFDFTGKVDGATWETARQICSGLSYTASGVLLQVKSLRELMLDVLGSFLISVYDNANGAVALAVTTPFVGNPPIAGTIRLGTFEGVTAVRSLRGAANKVTIDFAPSYANADRRTTTGVSKSGFLGQALKEDAVSQARYGVCEQNIPCNWVITQAVADVLASTVVTLFTAPLWILTGTDATLTNFGVSAGEYVAFSWEGLQDETGRSLTNQIGFVMERELDPNTGVLTFKVQDTGRFWYNLVLAMGLAKADGSVSAGAQREIRNL